MINIFLQLRSRHVAKSNVNSLSGNHEPEYWTLSLVVAIFNSYFVTILLSLRRVANYFKMVHHPIQFYLSHRDYVAMIFFLKKTKSLSAKTFLFLLKKDLLTFSFYVYECFVCLYIYASHACKSLRPEKHQIFWNWNYKEL